MAANDSITGLLVTSACRRLRVSPLAAAVLQDLLLDAHQGADGNIVVATSARFMAESLGLTPKQIATALAQLRRQHLLGLLPPRGRFGLSDYWVAPGPGRRIVAVADLDDRAGVLSAHPAKTGRAVSPPSGQPQLDLGEAGRERRRAGFPALPGGVASVCASSGPGRWACSEGDRSLLGSGGQGVMVGW